MRITNFKRICKMSQSDLKLYVHNRLTETHGSVTVADGFVFAQGKFPVLLVAHLDTVHKSLPASIYYDPETKRLSALEGIGGDDRCGVYMILEIVRKYNCSVLFTEDEEIGAIGADKFAESEIAKTFDCNYIVELDRRGATDAVFYDCDNPEFTDFVCKEYFKKSIGSFSDISIIAPALGVAAVNLSSGYYQPHLPTEYVVAPEVDRIIEETLKLLARSPATKFKYIKAKRTYGDYYGDYYGGYYRGYYSSYNSRNAIQKRDEYYLFEYADNATELHLEYEIVCASSEDEALGKFVKLHPTVPYNAILAIERDDSDDTKDTGNTATEKAESKTETEASTTASTNAPATIEACACCGMRINPRPYYTRDGRVCRECYLDYYSV